MSVTKKSQRHVAGLDGIRAIAIVAVILYHMDFAWIPGGFLGVDVFFVLSGYLITWILLERYTRLGSIDYKAFMFSRARRLLPAFLFLCLGIAIGVGLWAPDTISRFLRDLPFATTGTTNWWYIAQQNDYFDQIGRPSLLQHTWSLAIEAQFYFIWPVLVTLVAKKLQVARVRTAAIVGALISWAALLWAGMNFASASDASTSHLYFGTDTHSSGLFLGAALAVAWIPRNLNADVLPSARRFINAVGWFAVGILGCAFLFISEGNRESFMWGFPMVGLATALLIAAVIHPASALAKPLGNRVVQWIGTRSYGLYLWHWVIIQVLRPGIDVAWSAPLVTVVRIAIIAAITEFSYRFIEMPVRRGVIGNFIRAYKAQSARTKRFIGSAATFSLVIPLLTAAAIDTTAVSSSLKGSYTPGVVVTLDPSNVPTKITAPPVPDPTASQTPTELPVKQIYVFGDSVVLGAKDGFMKGFDVAGFRAKVGVQAPELIKYIKSFAAKKASDYDVIFDIGVNGTVKSHHLRQIFTMLKSTTRVIIINASVPRIWQDPNNSLIEQWAARYPNVRVADWRKASTGKPAYFTSDGVHLTQAGIKAYIACIQAAYESF